MQSLATGARAAVNLSDSQGSPPERWMESGSSVRLFVTARVGFSARWT